MALAGVELETLVSKPDALTTRPPPALEKISILANNCNNSYSFNKLISKFEFLFARLYKWLTARLR